MAKGLAGGVPIGAVLAKEKASVFDALGPRLDVRRQPAGDCAPASRRSNTIFEEGLIEHAAKMGAYRREGEGAEGEARRRRRDPRPRADGRLRPEARRRGPAGARGAREGVILNNTSPKTVRLIPPLIVTKSDMDEAFDTIDRLLPTL